MILLEIIAQACAVHGGWLAKNAGQSVRDAFLAGVRSFEILGKVVAGKAMEIEVALVKEFGGFHLYQGVVRQDKCEMARATLKAYHPVVSPLGA